MARRRCEGLDAGQDDHARIDAVAGIEWWNAMADQERRFWLAAAESAVPADAWEVFKRIRAECHPPGVTPPA